MELHINLELHDADKTTVENILARLSLILPTNTQKRVFAMDKYEARIYEKMKEADKPLSRREIKNLVVGGDYYVDMAINYMVEAGLLRKKAESNDGVGRPFILYSLVNGGNILEEEKFKKFYEDTIQRRNEIRAQPIHITKETKDIIIQRAILKILELSEKPRPFLEIYNNIHGATIEELEKILEELIKKGKIIRDTAESSSGNSYVVYTTYKKFFEYAKKAEEERKETPSHYDNWMNQIFDPMADIQIEAEKNAGGTRC